MFAKIKRNKNHLFIIGSFFLIVFGIFIIYCSCIQRKNIIQDNQEQVEEFFNKENPEKISDSKEVESKKKTSKKVDYNYIAVLEIEKINFKRGFVDINSKYNNLNYNILLIKDSDMPDVKNGNLMIAGHSGTSYISFFRNLEKLEKDDLIYVYYNNKKYIYKYSENYEVQKDGFVEVIRDRDKTTLTLITCKNNSNTQLVFISYLVDIVDY